MTIGYVVHGTGPVRAIVLHGWFGHSSIFDAMLPALDPARFSLAFLDYRGFGRSKTMSGPFDIDTIALDAQELATHLGWENYAVVGHSMGGKAALRLAANAPKRVTRILALTPVWAGAAGFDAQGLKLFRGAVHDVNLRVAILNHSTGGRLPNVWLRWLAQKSLEASTVEAFGAYFESWALGEFADQIRDLEIETLVVVGANDAGISVDATKATWVAKLANARLQVLADCGHYPMLEQPPALARIFERFLGELPDPDGA
jgi:pimeloyl-ACP methyl ester carboxylesterase